MPSETEKQRIAMAIAEHEPGKLYKRNRGMLNMSKEQLHEFASSVKGERRAGHPRTDEERKVRHKRLYGTEKLPPRGTGLSRDQRRSTRGSAEFTDAEIAQGYRKI
jgi:hypothetical protein